MLPRFEFQFHHVAGADAGGEPDANLALAGSLGWEIRGIASTSDGGFVVALQRPFGEERPLPDAPTLAATLEEPLAAPSRSELATEDAP